MIKIFIFLIDESKIIDQIFFNGNIQLKDEILLFNKNIRRSLFEKNKSLEDLKIISNFMLIKVMKMLTSSINETVNENNKPYF